MPGRIARLTCLIVCCFSTLLSAQDAPRIRIAAASDARLREDLQALVELAPANLKKQWKLLDETLEGFEEGVGVEPVHDGVAVEIGRTLADHSLVTVEAAVEIVVDADPDLGALGHDRVGDLRSGRRERGKFGAREDLARAV